MVKTDERFLEKYFSEGTLSEKEIYEGLITGISKGEIVPVMSGSATNLIDIETLLEDIVQFLPSPQEGKKIKSLNIMNKNNIKINCNEKEPFSALVFKTIIDPFIGRLSLLKVMNGVLNEETCIYNATKQKRKRWEEYIF